MKKWRVTKPSRQTRKKSGHMSSHDFDDLDDLPVNTSPTYGPPFLDTRPASMTDTATWSESGDWCPSPNEIASSHSVRSVEAYGSWPGTSGWDIPPLPPANDGGCLDSFPPFPMAQNHAFLHQRQISRSIPEDMISPMERHAPIPLNINHSNHHIAAGLTVHAPVSGAPWSPAIDTDFMAQHAQSHPQIQNWFAALPNTNPSSPSGFFPMDSPTISSPGFSHDSVSATTAPSSAAPSHYDMSTGHFESLGNIATSAPSYAIPPTFSPTTSEWMEKPTEISHGPWRHATSLSESNVAIPVSGQGIVRLNRLRSQTTPQLRRLPSKQKPLTSAANISPIPTSGPERSPSASVTPKQQDRSLYPGTPMQASSPVTGRFSPWKEDTISAVTEGFVTAV